MSGLVCNYAVLRFLPYRETGEFVNVGILVYCPQITHCTFRADDEAEERVSVFFPELSPGVFRTGLHAVKQEITRIRPLFERPVDTDKALKKTLASFRELTRPKEGLFQFGAPGVLLSRPRVDPVDELYEQFVLRQFARRKALAG